MVRALPFIAILLLLVWLYLSLPKFVSFRKPPPVKNVFYNPGAAAAIDEAIADGSIFSESSR